MSTELAQPDPGVSLDQTAQEGGSPNPDSTMENPADLKALQDKLAEVDNRYKHSSSEGIRLAQEVKALKEKLAATESQKTGNAQEPTFSEDEIVSWKVKELGLDEKVARHQARIEIGFLNELRAVKAENQSIKNQYRHLAEQQSQVAIHSNPELKAAEEFFADMPEMSVLSPIEKLDRYNKAKAKLSTATRRDTSALKSNASSPAGSNGGSSSPAPNGALDEQYRKLGYKGGAAQIRDLQSAVDDESYEAYMKKWNVKK